MKKTATPEPDDNNDPKSEIVTSEDNALAPRATVGDTVRASWNFSLDAIRSNIAHCSPEGRESLVAAFRWCIDKRHPVHKDDFSRAVGYDSNTIYKMFTGRYRRPTGELMDVPKKLIKAIREFLKLERERWLGGQTVFVETPTSKRIATHCELVRESQSMGWLWGPSHCGKTWALIRHAESNNHGRTVYVRLEAASGLGGMIRLIADAIGISQNSNTPKLIARIKRALTPSMLLILDETHQLAYTYRKESFFAAIEVLRGIFDDTECGMLLCGTRIMLDRAGSARQAELEQAWKRGVHKLNLGGCPNIKDVAAIVINAGLAMPARKESITVDCGKDNVVTDRPFEILRQLSREEGLKSITERIRYARKVAVRSGQKLTWEHWLLAHLTITSQIKPQDDGWS